MSENFTRKLAGILLSIAALGGCSITSLQVASEAKRELATSVVPYERISLVIRSYAIKRQPSGDAPEESLDAPRRDKIDLEQCLVEELQQSRDGMIAVVAQPLAHTTELSKNETPAVNLAHVKAVPPVHHLGYRYTVAVDATHRISEVKVVILPLILVGYFSNTRTEALELKATIYDVESGSLAGTALALSEGKTGTSAGYWGYAAAGMDHKYLDRTRVCRELAIKVRELLAGKE